MSRKEVGLETKSEHAPVSFLKLFRYSTCLDVVLMMVGTLASFLHGAAFPVAMFIFGDITNAFIYQAITSTELPVAPCPLDNNGSNTLNILNFTSFINMTVDCSRRYTFTDPITNLSCTNFTYQDVLTLVVGADTTCLTDQLFIDEINRLVYIFIGIAVCAFMMGMVQTWFFKIPAEHQVHNIRLRYYNSILRQEQAWFDLNDTGSVASHLSIGIETIHKAIGDNIGMFLQYMSTFMAAIVVGMVRQYQLALLLLAIVPFLGVAGFLFSRLGGLFSSLEQKHYASAGCVAHEVLGSISTVQAYGGERKECERYDKCLEESKRFGIYKGVAFGASIGSIYFLIFLVYSVSFWFGAYLVSKNMAQVGDIITVFFSILIGAFYVGQAGPNIQKLGEARAAASVIYDTIDKEVVIDSGSKQGLTPEAFEPTVTLSDVKFSFPSRPDTKVLNGLDLTVNSGQKLALVGSSGSGKTSVIKMIQRLYDVDAGEVMVGGQNVKDLNLEWLRAQIGVVSQEPVLFDTTIAENIRHGKEEASIEEIEEAARKANAHDFICSLPKGYETNVGEGGAQLSGGQKQRVAIARALVRDPKILLLDEATSALDSESEHLVQEALDKACLGRTTIVIAHRLSTIRDADLIASMEAGIVVEIGTHSELMEQKGHYFDLVKAQTYVEPPNRMAFNERRRNTLKRTLTSTEKRLSRRSKTARHSTIANTWDLTRSQSFSNTLRSVRSGSTSIVRRSRKDRVSYGTYDASLEGMIQNDTNDESWAHRSDRGYFKEVEDMEEEENNSFVSVFHLIHLNSKMLPVILLGCLGAAVNGIVFPAFSIIFGEVLEVFQRPVDQILSGIHPWAAAFIGIGTASAIAIFVKFVSFNISGTKLSTIVRSLLFKTMLKQEKAWYDEEDNSTGTLSTLLSVEAGQVQGAVGIQIGSLLEVSISLVLSLCVAFAYSWLTALVIVGFMPVIIIGTAIHIAASTGNEGRSHEALRKSTEIAIESLNDIHTVQAFGLERYYYGIFKKFANSPYRRALRLSWLFGVTYAFSQAIVFFGYIITFRFGAFQVTQPVDHYTHTTFDNVFRVFAAIVFASIGIGAVAAFVPDANKAKAASTEVFRVINKHSLIDGTSEEGIKQDTCKGRILFQNVGFSYLSRPDSKILTDFSLNVTKQTVGLVGPSGTGKSTILALVQRMYDPSSGLLTLDGNYIADLNVGWLRSQIGIVSQEPVLFDASIAENIRYGALFKEVSDNEVISAAKAANIHDFIDTLPMGYDTNVGAKGTQLSGGQKQRIAIARALVRDPKILLLDEATSALDTESEKVVQEALDKARKGRTTIIIAHRLSTIHNADIIAVMKGGKVVEVGTPSELLDKEGGVYYKMVYNQNKAWKKDSTMAHLKFPIL